MSEGRSRPRVQRGLWLLAAVIFITALGLALGLLSPFVAGSVEVGCAKNLGSPSAANDWAGEELVVVGWPLRWLDVTMFKDCFEPPSRVTGLAIDWVGFGMNETLTLVGIGLAQWLYALLRRSRIRTVSG